MPATEENPQSTNWVATLWLHQATTCLEGIAKDLTDTGRVRFIAMGEEVCPETGTLHYQTYISGYQNKKPSLKQLIKWFGTGHNFEVMRGTFQQNETYCSKQGTLHKFGDEPRQGERHDLIGFKRKLDSGLQPLEVAEEEGHFGAYAKYHAGFDKYAHHVRGKKMKTDREVPKVYIRVGEAGTGKTRWLDEQFGLDGWARMPNPTGSWWITPAVSAADTVLFDDVGPSKIPKVEEFLEWTDRYPVEFNSKGGFLWWKPKNIVFTSNVHPTQWWPKISDAHKAAVERRIFQVVYVYKDQPDQVYNNGDQSQA